MRDIFSKVTAHNIGLHSTYSKVLTEAKRVRKLQDGLPYISPEERVSLIGKIGLHSAISKLTDYDARYPDSFLSVKAISLLTKISWKALNRLCDGGAVQYGGRDSNRVISARDMKNLLIYLRDRGGRKAQSSSKPTVIKQIGRDPLADAA